MNETSLSAGTFVVHEITNFYQTALWGYYLKGVEAYADDLAARPFGDDVMIQVSGMP